MAVSASCASGWRQWLPIVSEELLRENRFDYEIIVAEPGRVCIALNSCTSARC
jgi:tRNA A22 N-methylase